jgi:hypothetical protein
MTDNDTGGTVPTDLEGSAAVVRFDMDDVDALLHALVERLSSVPGLKIVVTHGNRRIRRLLGDIPYVTDRHRRSDPIRRIAVTIRTIEYWVASTHGTLTCGIGRLTLQRGASNDPLPFAVWADRLVDEIVSQNHISHESVVALRNLIEGQRA